MKDTFGLEDHLPGLVERIVASYNSDERTHHIDKQFLPSRTRIVEALQILLELLYPGYWGRQHLTSNNVSYHVGELLPRIGEILQPVGSLYRLALDEVDHAVLEGDV